MAAFTTETAVREKFQATDAALVTPAAIEAAIEDAHTEVLARLDPMHDTAPAAEGLVLGETMLAGAHLLRALAAGDAVAQRAVSIGGQRVEGGARFAALMTMAAQTERHAWEQLAPFLIDVPRRGIVRTTDTQPILGTAE
jgi:hypothetical protein